MSLQDLLILILFVAALAIGWLLGRREKTKSNEDTKSQPSYFSGINYLLNEEKNEAIDSLISVLEKNTDSIDTHLVLAHMLRRRGEVERAIQIHQNLLSVSDLNPLDRHRINLELARNYGSIGLYDRAEALLIKEIESDVGDQKASFQYLLEIYQDTREWGRAIEVSEQIIGRDGNFWRNIWPRPRYLEDKLRRAVAHFYCELANENFQKSKIRAAKKNLKRALQIDAQSARANIQLAQLYMAAADFRTAIKRLQYVKRQDPELFPEIIPQLVGCYRELDDERGLSAYLYSAMADIPSGKLALALGEVITKNEGLEAGIRFFTTELNKRPSLLELEYLLGLITRNDEEPNNTIHAVVTALLLDQHQYCCTNCGFSGVTLHWLCPSCKEWGCIKPSFELDKSAVASESRLALKKDG
ncbi:MAG: lipopolysaccharide assembly protein LapB [Pseudomonadales bacterium]|nr:lipopolysaccharide assembly protein LapB [Pseudomonadales bacterium]